MHPLRSCGNCHNVVMPKYVGIFIKLGLRLLLLPYNITFFFPTWCNIHCNHIGPSGCVLLKNMFRDVQLF
jgi:hypothetical protein